MRALLTVGLFVSLFVVFANKAQLEIKADIPLQQQAAITINSALPDIQATTEWPVVVPQYITIDIGYNGTQSTEVVLEAGSEEFVNESSCFLFTVSGEKKMVPYYFIACDDHQKVLSGTPIQGCNLEGDKPVSMKKTFDLVIPEDAYQALADGVYTSKVRVLMKER